jgi:CubicO group peptidase (beta-lactamase class C family)
MTLSTSGWLASMTKLQTAVAALLAVQQGLVTLDEDVAYLLLELRDKKVLASYDPDTKIADWDDVREKITLRYDELFW